MSENSSYKPIGIFDSGFGGLTVMKEIIKELPQYDYLYLGDNARAPYGNRSFETVHEYTLQCVEWFFEQGCELVIIACNTASAKALRTIQQQDLPGIAPEKRVLGVIRPTAEVIGNYSKTRHVGVLGTRGTVSSQSYLIEINKFFPDIKVAQLACPLWVPIVEYGEYNSEGTDFFVKKYLDQLLAADKDIDTILLACTHYPILMEKIKKYLPGNVNIIAQGNIVADSLKDYLHRHPEMENRISKGGNLSFYTTDDPSDFSEHATLFFGRPVEAQHLHLQ